METKIVNEVQLEQMSEGLQNIGTMAYNGEVNNRGEIAARSRDLSVSDVLEAVREEPRTGQQEQQQLAAWNATQQAYPTDACVPHLVARQAAATPEAIALVEGEQTLTYRELNQRANQLAHYLQTLGVGPNVLVALCVERSFDLVVGLLGILKAGGAYVPLDPAYPPERLAFMLEDARVPVLLTQERLLSRLPTPGARVLCLDADWATIATELVENPINYATAENLAYVIYTSGSTGRPKGVMISHGGICNRLLWMQDTYQLSAADRVLQKTLFSFDVSVWEFFWPLMTGARLVMARSGGHQDSAYLV